MANDQDQSVLDRATQDNGTADVLDVHHDDANHPQGSSTGGAAGDDTGTTAIPFDDAKYLTATTLASGALFNADQGIENGPAMTGNITLTPANGEDGNGATYRVAAWKAPSQTDGKVYLQLTIGDRNQHHYLGRLFVNEDKLFPNSPDYSGWITLLPLTPGIKEEYPEGAWDEAPQLRVTGFKKRSAAGKARIQLVIAPQEVQPGELNFG